MSFASTERWRDVWLVAVAGAISLGGDFLAATALVLALQERGAAGFSVAAVLLATVAPPVLLAPFAGRLVDRVSSRLLLVCFGSAQAVTCAVLAFTDALAAIVGLLALLSAGQAVVNPTVHALLPSMVGRERLGRANAVVSGAAQAGFLLGPATAGILVAAFGTRVPLLVNAATYLAVVAAGLLVRTRRGGRQAAATRADAPVTGALAVLRGDAVLRRMIWLSTAWTAAVTMVNVAAVYLVRGQLGASSITYGLLVAIWGAAMIGGSVVVARWLTDDRRLSGGLAGSYVAGGAVQSAAGLVPAAGWLVGLYVVGGACNAVQNVAKFTLLGRRVPEAVRGRVFAFNAGITNGAVMVGYLAGGVALEMLAANQVFLLAGALGTLFGLVFGLPLVRAARRDASRAGAAVTPAELVAA